MTVVVVTGTGTGVGKTVATAALAAAALGAGRSVAVCKPVQTGAGANLSGDDDLADVARLAGVQNLVSVARYPEPLAPTAAAEQAGLPLPSAGDILAAIRSADRPDALTLVEGAGGLLVEIGASGITLRDLAVDLDAPVVVVCEPGLGTLNHTALTLEALANKGLSCAGLVIGRWPAQPDAAAAYNRGALDTLAPVRAVLPDGAGVLPADEFATLSRREIDPDWIVGLI